MKKKDSELIHVKVEYSEAVESKRDILSLEIDLLRMMKTIARYNSLRDEELNSKAKLSKKIKEAKNSLTKMQLILPKLKIPEMLKKENNEEETTEKKIMEVKKERENEDIEFQLREIREKLASLQK